MSILTVVQSKASNDFKAAANYKSATCTAVGSGNSLIFIITALTAELPFVIEPQAYNGTTDVPMVLITTDTSTAGMTRHLYKLDNITHAATSIRYKVNASSGSTQQASTLWEVGNTGGSALTLHVNQKTSKSSSTSFSENFTTLSPNEIAFVNLRLSLSNPTTAATAPVYVVTHANNQIDDLYEADKGSAGSKSIAWTTGSAVTAAVWITTFSNTSTVTSVTGTSVTEGTALRFTITLSGAPGANTDYTYSWGGTAVAVTDYDNNLSNATFSGGLSYVGGSIRFASGTTSGTMDVTTYDNALDQADRTLILTVGGTASTGGVIVDNDAIPAINMPAPVTVDGGDSVVLTFTLPVVSGRVTQARLVLTDGTKVGGVDYTNVITNPMISDNVTISGGVLSIPALTASFTITIPTTA